MRRARAVVLVIAVLALAWLGVSLRDAWRVSDASRIAQLQRPSAGEIRHGLALARSARLLNPNRSDPLSWEAELDIRAGNLPAARRAYEQLVGLEPQFAEAWFLLAALTRQSDPARSAQARARLRALDPLDRGQTPG